MNHTEAISNIAIRHDLLQYWFVVVSGLKRDISSPRLAFPFKHSDSCGPMPIAREQLKEIDECVQTKQGISASRWDWTYRLGNKGKESLGGPKNRVRTRTGEFAFTIWKKRWIGGAEQGPSFHSKLFTPLAPSPSKLSSHTPRSSFQAYSS